MRISDWSSDVCSSDLKDRAGAATLRNEATGKILIRCRRLGFPSDPFAQIPCAAPRKGAIAVDSAKVRQMLVPGLLAPGTEEQIVAGTAEQGRGEIRYLRRALIGRQSGATRAGRWDVSMSRCKRYANIKKNKK